MMLVDRENGRRPSVISCDSEEDFVQSEIIATDLEAPSPYTEVVALRALRSNW